jgi:hypothetical protein
MDSIVQARERELILLSDSLHLESSSGVFIWSLHHGKIAKRDRTVGEKSITAARIWLNPAEAG